MGIDADKNGLSRRDFLKMAGAGAAKVVIPDFRIPDPPGPKAREQLTDADKINLALPVVDRMNFLVNRGKVGFGVKMDLPNWPELVSGSPVGGERHKVLFPDHSLEGVRDSLSQLTPFIMPDKLSFFSHPQLNFSYQIPFNRYPALQDKGGNLTSAWQSQGVFQDQKFLPENVVAIQGGAGHLGQLWTINATEHHRFGQLEVKWLAARGIPVINQQFSLGSPTDRMAGMFNGDAEMYCRDDAGNLFAAVSNEEVLFIPVGLKVTPNTPPNRSPELNA